MLINSVNSLEGQQDGQSLNCTVQQYVNRLEKQVKEYEEKWDIYKQIEMNLDIITELFMKYIIHGNNWR